MFQNDQNLIPPNNQNIFQTGNLFPNNINGLTNINNLANSNQYGMTGLSGFNLNEMNVNMMTPGAPNQNLNNLQNLSYLQNYGYQQNNQLNNSILNTSQQNLNNSMPNLPVNNLGLGLLRNLGMGPNMSQDNPMANSYRIPGYNFQYLNQMAANNMYPQPMDMNYQGMMNPYNQMELLAYIENKAEEEYIKQERDRADLFKKDFQEEIQKLLLEKVNIDLNKRLEVYLQKSEYFYERDRFFFEELIQQPLKTEGFLGLGLVTTIDKSGLYNNQKNNLGNSYHHDVNIPEKEYFSKMDKDGVYLDYIKSLIYSYNIQKVEQRFLREEKYEMFKHNGDLKLDNDVFSDVVTKPIDISLTSNEKFKFHYHNSLMCSRASERNYKKYKMKFYLSKLYFKTHPLFSEEDVLCSELRELYKDFYLTMNSINIPYLKDKVMTINRQLDEYSEYKEPSEGIKKEMQNMRAFVSQTLALLQNEKKNLNEKANSLYNKWLELKSLRQRQNYQSTNLKLNVLRFPVKSSENPNIYDYAFILSHLEPSNNVDMLPKPEIERRNKIKKLKCFIKIYINGVFVSQSKKYNFQWPNFEVDINNLFHLTVHTRPTLMELELYIGNYTFTKLCRFSIEPPGVFMNTVTSSSSLVEEVEFESDSSNPENNIKKLERSHTLLDNRNDESDKLIPVNAKQQNTKKIMQNECKGRIYLKCEWEGTAPDMPPTKIEDKLQMAKLRVQKIQIPDPFMDVKKLNPSMTFDYPYDINDPRNIIFFEQMKKAKTELLLKYLNKEYNLPFYDVVSLRHFLLNKRLEKYSLRNTKVPLLDQQIEKDQNLKAIIKGIEQDKKETVEEYEQKIKTQLEKLNTLYSNSAIDDVEYLELLSKKVKTMKKDIINKLQLSYFQIVNEFFYSPDSFVVIKDLCLALFTPSRKMAPRKKRVIAVKVEKTTEIKINIHVLKGYNMPVRINAPTADDKEHLKAECLPPSYSKNQPKTWLNQLRKRNLSNSFNNLRASQMMQGNMAQNPMMNMGLGLMANQGIINAINNANNLNNPGLMAQNGINNNNLNNLNNLNNSNPFATPNVITRNNSLLAGINMNQGLNPNSNPGIINPLANSQPDVNLNDLNNLNQATIPQGFNPNLGNVLYNPNNQNMYPMYNQPMMNNPLFMGGNTGEVLNLIEQLQSLEHNIDSFINVKMNYYGQKIQMRTDSIDGIHPDYNYKMQFTIKPRNGHHFDRDEIAKCSGAFYFTLYDEVPIKNAIMEKDANTFIHRYEKKYLGAFQIPFSTIFQNSSMLETVCKVNVPMTVFGYYSDMSSAFDLIQEKEVDLRKPEVPPGTQQDFNSKSSYRLSDVPRIVNPYLNTYVSLYISLDPVPSFLKGDDIDYVPGYEDSVFLINTTKWIKNLKSSVKFSKRHFKLLAENFDGYSVFLPRYIKPGGQKPPEIIFDEINAPEDNYSIEKAARFVSLIPFIEDSQTFDYEDMPDCWCTDEQFLTLGFGDYEEHAILLCNFFNYIDKFQKKDKVESYLVLGKAYPEGYTTYVLRKSLVSRDLEFWNAKTGQCFYFDKRYHENSFFCFNLGKNFNMTRASSDSICQLQEIGCVVTSENVYFNIQEKVDPGLIDFDFDIKSNWTAFLNQFSRKKYFPNGISTIQRDLKYEQPNPEESYNLKNKIFQYVKEKVEYARSTYDEKKALRTLWERTANDKIENILCDYDGFYFTHKQSGVDEIHNEFIGVMKPYGFPINLSFTTLKQIWDEVELTDVHLIADEQSELSLSVFVNAYPAKVYSVWIFFAVLKN